MAFVTSEYNNVNTKDQAASAIQAGLLGRVQRKQTKGEMNEIMSTEASKIQAHMTGKAARIDTQQLKEDASARLIQGSMTGKAARIDTQQLKMDAGARVIQGAMTGKDARRKAAQLGEEAQEVGDEDVDGIASEAVEGEADDVDQMSFEDLHSLLASSGNVPEGQLKAASDKASCMLLFDKYI